MTKTCEKLPKGFPLKLWAEQWGGETSGGCQCSINLIVHRLWATAVVHLDWGRWDHSSSHLSLHLYISLYSTDATVQNLEGFFPLWLFISSLPKKWLFTSFFTKDTLLALLQKLTLGYRWSPVSSQLCRLYKVLFLSCFIRAWCSLWIKNEPSQAHELALIWSPAENKLIWQRY